MEHGGEDGHIYISDQIGQTVIIVEGPIDALKVAVAGRDYDVTPIALLGKDLGPARLRRLQMALVSTRSIFICLDADTTFQEARTFQKEISATLLHVSQNPATVLRTEPPEGHKDPGAASLEGLGKWLERLKRRL